MVSIGGKTERIDTVGMTPKNGKLLPIDELPYSDGVID